MARMTVEWDERALEKAMNRSDEVYKAVESWVAKKRSHANTMASGYESRGFYQHGELVDGKKQARYDGNVKRKGNGWIVGIVYCDNHAASVENKKHNTLLKA